MAPPTTEKGPLSVAIQWLHGLWEYYRVYTNSAIHAAAVAALTIFGLLIFIDPLFAVLAIASYIGPPLVLYVFGATVGADSTQSDSLAVRSGSDRDSDGDSDADNGDTDSDTDDGDTDSDTNNGDTDSDTDDGDSDSDTDGADADTDSDTDG